MSIRHLNWAWDTCERFKLSPSLTLVVVALADSASHESGVGQWENAQKLADRVRISRRSLFSHLNELASIKLIRRAKVLRPDGVCDRLLFWINPPDFATPWPLAPMKAGFKLIESPATAADEVNAECEICTAEPSAVEDTPQVQPIALHKNPLVKPTTSSLRSEVDVDQGKSKSPPPEFEELWKAATPTMRKRSDAKARVFAIARPLAAKMGWSALIEAMRTYVRSKDVREGLGQPAINRWLARGLYEQFLGEDAPAARPRSARDAWLDRVRAWSANAESWDRRWGAPPDDFRTNVPPSVLKQLGLPQPEPQEKVA